MEVKVKFQGSCEEGTITDVSLTGITVRLKNPYFDRTGYKQFATVRDEHIYKTVAVEYFLTEKRAAIRKAKVGATLAVA